MKHRRVELPSLRYDYNDARIDDVSIGPRRELNLVMAVLTWEGSTGRYVEGIKIRFGGIENFEEVSSFFARQPHEQSELASLAYSAHRKSKMGQLFFEMVFERIDARLEIHCSSLQISEASSSAPESQH
jgi:hypothetical protein